MSAETGHTTTDIVAPGMVAGAKSLGPSGGEVLSLLTLETHARTPIEELTSMIYASPRSHRGIGDPLRNVT